MPEHGADRKELTRDLERLGPGICDGCGENAPLLFAFNAPQIAFGICLCEPCVTEDPDDQ